MNKNNFVVKGLKYCACVKITGIMYQEQRSKEWFN